ncbi:hypothetical protein [Pseudoxanthomonas mexicana]|uniref:hypothetical protein n=1 Tax=Pseudoxanthomonas mexicana TaxID=128785 RepID=UPI00398B1E87
MHGEDKSRWWRQLGGMSQGMLFLHGHIAHPCTAAPQEQEECRCPVHDAATGPATNARCGGSAPAACVR